MTEGIAMATELRPHRFTVDEYERMAETGVLPFDMRTELLEGAVVEMPPIGDRHAGTTSRLLHLCFRRFDDLGVILWPQNPVVMRPRSMPQPDVCLLRPRADGYEDGKPTPGDVLLLVEIADSSLRVDLGFKAELYARHGVAEYWVVDLVHRRIEVFTTPRDGAFAQHATVSVGRIAPLAIPDRFLAIDEIFRPSSAR